ncbi:MAG: SDR family NAD(P)-dependent oxidoreductase, partial [Anaerolineales bacterium]|nr:SDR family NAD(P)-dependent oxidoreductase [Anaerolineales bacterium]
MDANGKVAVITGASDGLGAVLAQQLAAAGYHVWVLARNEAKLQAVVGAIRSGGGQADYAVCDVTSPESVAQSF